MTVEELMAALAEQDPSATVVFVKDGKTDLNEAQEIGAVQIDEETENVVLCSSVN